MLSMCFLEAEVNVEYYLNIHAYRVNKHEYINNIFLRLFTFEI